jgi:lauroyl/myristoyl acyltransferase
MPEHSRPAVLERPPEAITEPTPPPGPPLDLFQKVMVRLLILGLWLGRRLPDKPLYRAAFTIGAGLYLLMPERRQRVRDNLRRVVEWLAANDMASPRVAKAARDRVALDRMVRATFGHWVLTYAEAALAPRYGAQELRRRLVPVDADVSREATSARPVGVAGPIHLAMHFGSVDLSALYGARVGELPVTGPMEFVDSPIARAYFERVRNELGVTIVPLDGAAEALTGALKRGEAVGIVGDRNIVGRGSLVHLFGAPMRLPVGPALLSIQTGADLYLEAIERTGTGDWMGHTVPLRAAPGVTRREATRSLLEQEVQAMERIIARAPEQWTTLFFPIWEDEADE